MKPSYIDFKTCAMINLSELAADVFEVNRINTPAAHRGKGIARTLVKEMLSDADVNQVKLVLDINPYGPMDFSELESWYQRLGFKLEADHRYWRQPVK